MISAQITITNPTGLHTRPGQRFVTKSKEFECDILVKKDGKDASGKSLLKLLKLGISEGNTIELICDGSDEELALNELIKFVEALTD